MRFLLCCVLNAPSEMFMKAFQQVVHGGYDESWVRDKWLYEISNPDYADISNIYLRSFKTRKLDAQSVLISILYTLIAFALLGW